MRMTLGKKHQEIEYLKSQLKALRQVIVELAEPKQYENVYTYDNVLQSFKIEAQNHHVHEITKSEGKWNDEKLQRLSTLALELVDCLGDKDAFESLLMIKWNLSSELAKQYALPMKKKHKNNEDEFQERKRHMNDEELRELIDFALNIVNKLESENKEHLNQIV
ncbi:hypothetical protein C1645_833299 [Glomus cerebriforme]|uniref:Uncharacterized protein n=1 Tax=Glomus cerebriforme TaxID=658196 RepID=A0A397SBT1_9GLOM|nr:hypothetical protein C1645_833299 [Glomus cerebriforme]